MSEKYEILYAVYSGCAHEGYAIENDGRIFNDICDANDYIEKKKSQGSLEDWDIVEMNISKPGIWKPGRI